MPPLTLSLRRAARVALDAPKRARNERIKRSFASAFLGDRATLSEYEREVRASGLLDHLWQKGREFQEAVRGVNEQLERGYTLGAIGYLEGMHLYAVLRTVKPRFAVETGVANGFSTAFSLLALEKNGDGELYSIDLPREVGKEYEPGTFYEGSGRTGFPQGQGPGWLVPEHLRDPWTLILGRTRDELPPLLRRLGTIDSFLHDSEHSFENMWFEYSEAWPALRDGGVLLSHDVNTTPAFFRFADKQGREPIKLSNGMALVVK